MYVKKNNVKYKLTSTAQRACIAYIKAAMSMIKIIDVNLVWVLEGFTNFLK